MDIPLHVGSLRINDNDNIKLIILLVTERKFSTGNLDYTDYKNNHHHYDPKT